MLVSQIFSAFVSVKIQNIKKTIREENTLKLMTIFEGIKISRNIKSSFEILNTVQINPFINTLVGHHALQPRNIYKSLLLIFFLVIA